MKRLTIKCAVCIMFGIANKNYDKTWLKFIFGSTIFKLENMKVGYWATDDGDMSFKSEHLIHGGHQLHVVLSTLFNSMLIHGYILHQFYWNLLSCQFQKIINPRYQVVTIIGGFLYSIVFVNCIIMWFCIYLENNLLRQKCNLALKNLHYIMQFDLYWSIKYIC